MANLKILGTVDFLGLPVCQFFTLKMKVTLKGMRAKLLLCF